MSLDGTTFIKSRNLSRGRVCRVPAAACQQHAASAINRPRRPPGSAFTPFRPGVQVKDTLAVCRILVISLMRNRIERSAEDNEGDGQTQLRTGLYLKVSVPGSDCKCHSQARPPGKSAPHLVDHGGEFPATHSAFLGFSEDTTLPERLAAPTKRLSPKFRAGERCVSFLRSPLSQDLARELGSMGQHHRVPTRAAQCVSGVYHGRLSRKMRSCTCESNLTPPA